MFGQITSSDKGRQIPMSGTYQVFLSFRGSDTRFGFTGNLYKALTDRGIHTFIDDEELQRGDQITPALMKAIQESRIAIPVLSTNYASSSFCLEELTHILHRSNSKGMLVLPVFYEVDPSDVRHWKGSYGDALAKHEERLKHNMDKLQSWKDALSEVANLSGYHFKKGYQYEYKFIEKIVEQVSKQINLCLHVADYPVGLESATFRVTDLLALGTDDGAHMVGIHGMGGIGKSTLARAVYNNLIADNFDGTCFIANVREKSTKHGLEYLQSILFSEILKEDIISPSCEKGVSMIKERFQRKKVLLVLDDVDDFKQLKACVGSPSWFGLGSKIIITTRDTQLLPKCHIKITYEVETLDNNDALRLLTLTAFKGKEVDSRYKEVLNRVVTYASGLPLALEVIGSNLAEKSIQNWEDAIDQYKRIPPGGIQNILKVSFDALEEKEQSIFLDIACCFNGYRMIEVENILGAHYGCNIKPHLEVLVEKSLLKLDHNYYYTMHDLIEDMGKNIVNQESSDEPAERSRLWSGKDIIEVLEENKGTSKIKIICLDLSINEEMIEWNGKGFKKMEKLKTLIIKNANFSKAPKCLPNSLRVLEWEAYPSGYLPSDFLPKKLGVCNLPYSHIKSFQLDNKLMHLTVLNFRGCKFLEETPDVSYFPNLKELSFDCCKKLTTIHCSVGFHDKLKILSAANCSNLKSFPPLNLPSLQMLFIPECSSLESLSPINLSSIRALELSGCSSLGSFPEITEKINNLDELELRELSIAELPWASFQNLCGLFKLHLYRFGAVQLPSKIFTELGLITFKAEFCEGLHCPDLGVGEELSTVRFLTISYCNLSDDIFDKGFQRKGMRLEVGFTFQVKVFQSGSINEARGDIRVLFGFVISFPLEFSVVLLHHHMMLFSFLTISGCNLSDDLFDKGFQRFARVKHKTV
ncbi:hypothetical protein Fmac_015561 [Flemingia macrophylla]|uniref:TIR domain-containing protein n=1 Tax=Flemingia macrophylla TaxID=520843 RepID=A0ABD1MEX3_9FABA